MFLKIKVSTYQGKSLHQPMEHSFDQHGGTFGRGADNNWKLQDNNKFLSRTQAEIFYDGIAFHLKDLSSNGCFINGSQKPLGKGNTHQLDENDTIRAGDYVLSISFEGSTRNEEYWGESPHTQQNEPSINDNSDFAFAPRPKPPVDDPFGDIISGQEDIQRASTKEDFQSSSPNPFDDNIFDPKRSNRDTPSPEESIHDDPFSDIFKPKGSSEKPIDQAQGNPPRDIHDSFILPKPHVFGENKETVKEKSSFSNSTPSDTFDDPKKPFTDQTSTPKPTTTPNSYSDIFDSPKKPFTDQPSIKKTSTPDIPDEFSPSNEGFLHREENITNKPQTKLDTNKAKSDINKQAIDSILTGAGINPEKINNKISSEIYYSIGQILNEVLQGTMDLLKSRAETKNHLRVERTMIGIEQNNPLKYLPNAEYALIQFFRSNGNDDESYLSLLEGAQEAIDDIKAHQMAMAMSIQHALIATIKDYFCPTNLQKKLEKTNPISSKIPLQREATLWKMFEDAYDDIESEAAENFESILEKKITKSYQLHMDEIKKQRYSKK